MNELEDIQQIHAHLNENLIQVSNTLTDVKSSLKGSLLTCESVQNDQQALLVNVTKVLHP